MLSKSRSWLGLLPVVALAACDPPGIATNSAASRPMVSEAAPQPQPQPQPLPGGGARWGTAIATMADQYRGTHPGAVPAAGASAWVPAAPPPAFVVTGPEPPAAPPPAPPAAVANRQPSAAARPAVPVPEIERPEAVAASGAPELQAASPAPAAAVLTAAQVTRGRQLFNENGCGACHALADAGGAGGIGPGFDGNRGLTRENAFSTIHAGRGAMPSFGGQIPDADIRTLAAYIVQVRR